jgi:hypothetical protein
MNTSIKVHYFDFISQLCFIQLYDFGIEALFWKRNNLEMKLGPFLMVLEDKAWIS